MTKPRQGAFYFYSCSASQSKKKGAKKRVAKPHNLFYTSVFLFLAFKSSVFRTSKSRF